MVLRISDCGLGGRYERIQLDYVYRGYGCCCAQAIIGLCELFSFGSRVRKRRKINPALLLCSNRAGALRDVIFFQGILEPPASRLMPHTFGCDRLGNRGSSCFGPGNPIRASWERRRLAGKGIAIAASFVLAISGTLRLRRKAVVGFILLPPGRPMPFTF